MQYFLDVVGSFIIGGIILLILVNLNLSSSNSAAENLKNNISQSNLTSTAQIIENDLYKIGYRITGEWIVVADSTELKFFADIDNNGIKDSIHYYIGETSQLFSTFNPNDRLLYRVVNNETPKSSNVVVDFSFSYFDSLGAMLSYTSLKNASSRRKIKTITVNMYVESTEPVEGIYPGVAWKKTIIPKNLKFN